MSRRMTILLFAVVAAQVIGLVVFAGVRQGGGYAGTGGYVADRAR